MSGFVTALIKQRIDAKKAGPDTSGRLKEIVDIIRKYDYDDGFTPEIIVGIIQDLGPTFVKIGQIASQQPEYIPPEYCDALSKLRSSVAPMDVDTVHSQIEKHLGKPVDELFASFDDKPLGSASIGQVHKATLFDGTVVAVKVRRPGVVETVARDFALIESLLDTFIRGNTEGVDIKALIMELEKTSKAELDFTNEANNLERFWENNIDRAQVEIPKCYRELTNEAILTEDFVSGHEVGDASFLDSLDDDERYRIAALVADNFASQVLVDGFYHADPHSGNVLIKELQLTPEPAAAVDEETTSEDKSSEDESIEQHVQLPEHGIEWIDFGMMGQLTQQQRQVLIDLVTAVVMKDAYALKRTVLKVSRPQGAVNHGALLEMCESMCDQYTGKDFGDFDLGDLLSSVLGGLQDENYKIDPFLTNLSRGIVTVEGTIKSLSPHVNILNFFTEKADLSLDFDYKNLSEDDLEEMKPIIAMQLMKFLESVSKSSDKTAETLDMLEKAQIRMNSDFSFEDKGLAQVERLVNNSIRTLIIIALFVGSCILCTISPTAMAGSTININFPIIGFVGYIVSVWLTYFLYRDIKKGK